MGCFRLLPIVLLCCFLAVYGFGQNPTAQVSGTISDVSGAAIPRTELRITNVDTAVALADEEQCGWRV